MAVTSVTTMTLKPDKYEEFLKTTSKAKAVLERHGAKNVRLMGSIVAGEQTGTLVTTWEADDYAAYGAVMDKFLADQEGLALLMSTNSESGPLTSFQGSLWSDIEV